MLKLIEAARKRKREVLLGPGRFGALMRLIAPRAVDSIIINAVLKPLIKRISNGVDKSA